MNQHAFDIPGHEPRMRWVWFVLFGMFGLLITMAVGSSFLAQEPSSQGRALTQDLVIKQIVLVNESLREFGMQPKRLSRDDFDSVLSALEKGRAHDPLAASTYLVVGHEAGLPSDPQALEVLEQSPMAAHRRLAEVYRAEKLGPARAQELKENLAKERRFIYRLAGVHALEKAGTPDARSGLSQRALVTSLIVILVVVVGLGLLGLVLWGVYLVARSAGRFGRWDIRRAT